MINRIELLKKIDFGDIDGYGDPKLDKYFLDNDYWDKVINQTTYFIIGKKGTGKSSIYRMIKEQGISRGAIVDNRDFGDFPFEKLLQLDDNSFAKPNQYQSIWKNLILNIFAKAIANSPAEDDYSNSYFNEIERYSNVCLGNLVEMHKELVTRTMKTSGGLSLEPISASHETERSLSIGDGSNNISTINSSLENYIIDYFITCSSNKKIYIQFDRLDDNYNQYLDTEQYYQAIISLFKTVYYLNQKFRSKNIKNAKVILYLRSDILKELGKRDAESARWDDFSLKINWAITNRTDWKNSKLLEMINKGIQVSLEDPNADFSMIFNNEEINLSSKAGKLYDVFQYIVERTMYRPRDLIQFCKSIQSEVIETNQLYFRTIKNAEKKYGYWLVNSELANEINPILNCTDDLYELLKLMGKKPFSLREFNEKHRSFDGFDMSSKDLAFYLYDVGVFQNIDISTQPTKYRSIFRNEGRLDRNMKIIIHSGVWTGINA